MWVLVPWPGIKAGPSALWAQSLYHWTAREVPGDSYNGSTRGMGLYSRDKGRKSNWINDDLRPIPWLPGQSFNKPNLGQGVPLGLGKKKNPACLLLSCFSLVDGVWWPQLSLLTTAGLTACQRATHSATAHPAGRGPTSWGTLPTDLPGSSRAQARHWFLPQVPVPLASDLHLSSFHVSHAFSSLPCVLLEWSWGRCPDI